MSDKFPFLYKDKIKRNRMMIRDAVEDERQRCVNMFVKWGIENLSLHDLELLEHFVTEWLEVKDE